MSKGELLFFCGKMGAGKSAKASQIAQERNAILLSEDEWLESLYPNKIHSVEDYVKYANRLKPQMKNLVQSIIRTGTNVVMDFPANTVSQRDWFRQVYTEIEAPHHLIYLDMPNKLCLQQIAKRRKSKPHRAATDTVEMFEAVTRYFQVPTSDEGFNMTIVSQAK
jgi:predicted kinase